MFTGGDNYKSQLKDLSSLSVAYGGQGPYARFQERANKLVTAIYMVTDIMDTSEPIRNTLRASSNILITDIYQNSNQTPKRISEIMSFLGIGYTVGLISEMNYNILRKEFNSFLGAISNIKSPNSFWSGGPTTLLEFFKEETLIPEGSNDSNTPISYKGHPKPSRLGVQKAETFMQVLSDKLSNVSVTKSQDYDVLKNRRRNEITDILKRHINSKTGDANGLTITDIKRMATGVLATCGEKTIQRELVAMVRDGVLSKSGSKRWSRYSINQK